MPCHIIDLVQNDSYDEWLAVCSKPTIAHCTNHCGFVKQNWEQFWIILIQIQ